MQTAVFLSGLLFSLSLIVAIGAQNAYVLRQGARRTHVGTVVLICAASDVALIAAGVAGVGAVVIHRPGLLVIVRDLGAALLVAYGVLAARRALGGAQASLAAGDTGRTRRGAAAAAFGFTWLNPAVYLDTLVLLGTVASAHPHARWWFAAGAAAASVAWFIGLGFGARLLTPLLRSPQAWRLLDIFVAVVMTITALRTLSL
ncbi:MAG: LysE family transporter [Solirubrobacterales bacterium]|nr:LysE family transporter [Solirubrobacterales bacterium]